MLWRGNRRWRYIAQLLVQSQRLSPACTPTVALQHCRYRHANVSATTSPRTTASSERVVSKGLGSPSAIAKIRRRTCEGHNVRGDGSPTKRSSRHGESQPSRERPAFDERARRSKSWASASLAIWEDEQPRGTSSVSVPQKVHSHLLSGNAARRSGNAYKQYRRKIFKLIEAREWQQALMVVGDAIHKLGRAYAILLNWRAKALLELQEYAVLADMLKEFAFYEIEPSRTTFQLILQGHLRNHDLVQARGILQSMDSAGLPLDTSTFVAIIKSYRGLGLDKFIEDHAYDILGKRNAQGTENVLNAFLQVLLDAGDLDAALRLLKVSEEGGGRRYPTRGSDVASGHDQPVSGLDALRRRAIVTKANAESYSLLVKYLVKQQNLSPLDGILHRMRIAQITPDVGFASALVRAYYAMNMENMALNVADAVFKSYPYYAQLRVHLERLGLRLKPVKLPFDAFDGPPSRDLLHELLKGSINEMGMEAALIVMKMMQILQIDPESATVDILLAYLVRNKKTKSFELTKVVKDMMLSRDVQPSLKTLNTILLSVVKTEKRSVYKAGWYPLAAHVKDVTASPTKYEPKEEPSQSDDHVSMLTNDPSLNITLQRSLRFQRSMKPIIASLNSRSVQPDRATFSMRMLYDVYTRNPGEALESANRTMQEMKDRGLHPNSHHYAALMSAHCASGNMQAAHTVMKDAEAQGVVKTQRSKVILYTILISAYSRAGRPDKVMHVFQEMLDADISPDFAVIDAIVGSFYAVKAFGLAKKLLLDLWPMVAPLPANAEDLPLRELSTMLRSIRHKGGQVGVVPSLDIKRRDVRRKVNKLIKNLDNSVSKNEFESGPLSSIPDRFNWWEV